MTERPKLEVKGFCAWEGLGVAYGSDLQIKEESYWVLLLDELCNKLKMR